MLSFLFNCSICVILFKAYVLKRTFWNNSTAVSYSKWIHIPTKGRGVEKSVLKYIHTKWMAPSKCCGIDFLCIGSAKYTKASLPVRKMSLFSSIIITIILSYAIIRIYTLLLIYLQVSETEGLAELHWVIGLSVLEKINSISFQGVSPMLSGTLFQESACS